MAFLGWGLAAVLAFRLLFALCSSQTDKSSFNLELVARLQGVRRLSAILHPGIYPKEAYLVETGATA